MAILFEIDGFGRPPDAGVRSWYVGLLGAGLVAGIAVPAALIWWLFPGSGRGWVVAMAGGTALVVVVSLGLR